MKHAEGKCRKRSKAKSSDNPIEYFRMETTSLRFPEGITFTPINRSPLLENESLPYQRVNDGNFLWLKNLVKVRTENELKLQFYTFVPGPASLLINEENFFYFQFSTTSIIPWIIQTLGTWVWYRKSAGAVSVTENSCFQRDRFTIPVFTQGSSMEYPWIPVESSV